MNRKDVKIIKSQNEGEILVKFGKIKVIFPKGSNTFKVGNQLGYLSEIVWEEVTENMIKQVMLFLQRRGVNK